ncbi:hypothetical protein Tco_0736093 [Tanacetum coccineum]
MSLDSFHSTLSALEFDTFCNDYGIGSEFGPELPGPNDTIRDFPQGKIGHFEISCRARGRVLTVHFFRRFYLAGNLPTWWITIEKRRKKKNTIVPTCHTEPFDSLKGWRDKFFSVNASVAPIAMQWFTGKDFPQDSAVDGIDGDMVLETLLNDNPTRIRRYL